MRRHRHDHNIATHLLLPHLTDPIPPQRALPHRHLLPPSRTPAHTGTPTLRPSPTHPTSTSTSTGTHTPKWYLSRCRAALLLIHLRHLRLHALGQRRELRGGVGCAAQGARVAHVAKGPIRRHDDGARGRAAGVLGGRRALGWWWGWYLWLLRLLLGWLLWCSSHRE